MMLRWFESPLRPSTSQLAGRDTRLLTVLSTMASVQCGKAGQCSRMGQCTKPRCWNSKSFLSASSLSRALNSSQYISILKDDIKPMCKRLEREEEVSDIGCKFDASRFNLLCIDIMAVFVSEKINIERDSIFKNIGRLSIV